jgi:predicted unusual protein kinase regulating ubiquinone biosynthesis (AarF/ABC1/UbiB family)
MINNFKKNINCILFLINVFYITSTETIKYIIFKDYNNFIDGLTTRLSSINILYVKIFQAFALNNSFIDDKTNNNLLKFTDNAPWNFKDFDLYKLVEMGDKYNIKFRRGYEVPINSGMISLVFKGYKNDSENEPIIIKMKRKNIQQRLDEAIDNLLFLMYILSFIPIINKYQLAEVVNKNIEIIRHQTNFIEEIDNMDKIRENCKNLKYVKIPKANREITEEYSDIIVMDYIQGIKINEIKEEDYDGFAKLVVKFGIVTTILHGVTHGDLHSGNILFIKDKNDPKYPYKIGVIDFGIIYNINSQYKGFLFDIFTQLFEKTPRESAEKFLNSGIVDPPGILQQISKEDYDNILSFTEEIMNETINSSKKANQLQIYKFVSKFKEYLSKDELCNIGIRPSDHFVKSQLVLAMSHGVTLTLCKNDFITLLDKVINELFHTDIILQT